MKTGLFNFNYYEVFNVTFARHLVDRFKLRVFNVVDVEFPQRSAPSRHLGSKKVCDLFLYIFTEMNFLENNYLDYLDRGTT
jgi:hypothetical protein